MTLIRRVAILLVLVSLVAGCVGPCAEEPPPPAPAEEAELLRLKPTAEEIEEIVKMPERDVLALVADLESDDPAVVLAAAKQLQWRELTAAEMERIVPLLWRAYLANLDGDVDWNELRSYVGSAEVADMIRSLPDRMDKGHAEFIAGGLHRMMRAEHLPVVAAKLLEIENPDYLHALTWDLFGLPLEYTDRHRELAARTLLRHSMPPGAPVWQEPESSGPGYPALLVSVLRRIVEEGALCPFPNAWIGRWMYAERPGPKDAALLIEVIEHSEATQLREPAERALGFLSDRESFEALGGSLVATGALARRGDEAAMESLCADARQDAEALAVLLDVAPVKAVAGLKKRILGPSPAAERALLDLQEVLLVSRYWYGTSIDESWFDGFADQAMRRKLTGTRLALIGAIVPGCRTREIARAACDGLARTPPLEELLDSWRPLAFLEVGAPEALRAVLRLRARSSERPLRDWARSALLRWGDAESAPLLIEYVRELGNDEIDTAWLAESGGAGVEAFLREIGDDEALAVCHGLPAAVWLDLSDVPAGAGARRLIREGRLVDAILEILSDESAGSISGFGRIRDERLRKYLVQCRAERQDVPWATGELMLMGDEAAREETWKVLTTGRYRWVDEADTEILTLDHDLSTIPHWLDDLESNCCRFNVVACIFDDLFGLDLDEFRNSPVVTPARVARDFWERHGGNLVWSRTAGCFVPCVR